MWIMPAFAQVVIIHTLIKYVHSNASAFYVTDLNYCDFYNHM